MRSLPGRNRNRYTAAVSNKRIKENLVKVDAEFAEDIHIRIPVIPTVNMNENNMMLSSSAAVLRGLRRRSPRRKTDFRLKTS